MKSIYKTTTPEQTMELGLQLASRLMPGSTVLLFGDLGSGKTHFTKGIAKGLGIEEMIKSPTFTYVNEYKILRNFVNCRLWIGVQSDKISDFKKQALETSEKRNSSLQVAEEEIPGSSLPAVRRGGLWKAGPRMTEGSPEMTKEKQVIHFYHYDLYRLNKGESLEPIGLFETLHDPYSINVIEWADRMEGYEPKDYIQINFHSLADHHQIEIEFKDSQIVPLELVEKFWEDWTTPLHVREHCKQAAKVAVQIGQALIEQNILINLNLVNTATLLHDMARVCDFSSLDKAHFNEEITDEKWLKWVDLREQFKGMSHADVACGALLEEGFNKSAEVICLHNSLSILEEPEKFRYLEIALVFYADKRAKHDQIVDLKERFRDGRERHNAYSDAQTNERYKEAEEKIFQLEKELFSLIDLKPEDIK